MWKVISFYTKQYKREVDRLICSLKKFNIDCDIEYYESDKSWIENTNYKQVFIKKKLLEYKHPLVWLDADAEVVKYPKYFDVIEEDVGLHVKDFDKLQTGTMYFKYKPNVLELLDVCIRNSKVEPKIPDGRHFHGAIRSRYLRGWLTMFTLPYSYYYIFDLYSKWKDPVIKHYQASRRFR